MIDISENQLKAFRIFNRKAFERTMNAHSTQQRFVHYTSASAAMSIVQKEEVWMRKSACMNDFMEVQHGLNCLNSSYRSVIGGKFKATLNSIFPGVTERIEAVFNSWIPHLKSDTYFTCISEHLDAEDKLGRLSMWRAYGHNSGIAFVLNNSPFLTVSNALQAYTSPVEYMNDAEFEVEMDQVTQRIFEEREFIASIGEDELVGKIFEMFRYSILCTKHPGFSEEREWRIIYSPSLAKSEYIRQSIECVNGNPQSIYKIPLQNIPEKNLVGASISELLDRIIIGPSQFSGATAEAIHKLLDGAGVKDAGKKIFISDIPLRQN